jgi:tetratricopeptide (TPR) repeat protein
MAAYKQAVLIALSLTLLLGSAFSQISTSRTKRTVRVPEEEQQVNPLARAEAALAKNDYASAEPLLKQTVATNPKDSRAWFDLGLLYNATGRKAESIDAYRRSVEAEPKAFESTLNLGLVLAQAGDPEAEKYLRAATQLKPGTQPNENLEHAWLSLGEVVRSKDAAGALAAYAEAARLVPADPEPRLLAATMYERQGQFESALKEYQAAAQLDAKSADAHLGLANMYVKLRRLPEAETALRQYIEFDPHNSAARVQLGRVLLAENKTEDALAFLESSLQMASDSGAQRELASMYFEAGKYDKAEAAYRVVLQREPNDAAAHAGLGAALLRLKRTADAQKELLTALRLDPKLGEAYGDLAMAASENKDYPLTIRALDARAKFMPEAPGTWFLRATAYDNLRDYQHAAEYYRQFLAEANGRFPDQEWQARHRLIAITPQKKR